MTKTLMNKTLKEFKHKDYNKVIDSLDYFMALILQSNPDADIVTIQKFILSVKTRYWPKFWKKGELDLYMVQAFNILYEKIDPIRNNWPKLQDKFSDLTETINQTLSTDGSQEDCKIPDGITDIAVKKYIVAILNQSSNYSENSVKTEQMNRNLIDDVQKILNLPNNLQLIDNAVLGLQPYIYDNDDKCGGCGSCNSCCNIQKWEKDDPYYVTIMKRLDELCKRMGYYESKKKGDKGDRGLQGISINDVDIEIKEVTEIGNKAILKQDLSNGTSIETSEFLIPKGNKGDKGDKGDTGSVKNLATINNQPLDEGGNLDLVTPQQLTDGLTPKADKTYVDEQDKTLQENINKKQDDLQLERERMPNGDFIVKYKDKQDDETWDKAPDNTLLSKQALLTGNIKQGSLDIIDVNSPEKSMVKIAEGSGQLTWNNTYGTSNDTIMQSYPQNDNNFDVFGKDGTNLIEVNRQNNSVKIINTPKWVLIAGGDTGVEKMSIKLKEKTFYKITATDNIYGNMEQCFEFYSSKEPAGDVGSLIKYDYTEQPAKLLYADTISVSVGNIDNIIINYYDKTSKLTLLFKLYELQ